MAPELETRLEPVVGWRNYQLYQPHFLISNYMVHRPRVKSEAWCQEQHLAPSRGCSCGLYSFKTLEALLRDNYHRNADFISQVKFWGKVIEHEGGYKAQYSYPTKIWAVSDKAKVVVGYLGFLYGVEVGKPEELKLEELSKKNLWPLTAGTAPTPAAPKPARLSMEQLIYAAFNESLEIDLRRFARTRASAMLTPHINSLDSSIVKLRESLKFKTMELDKKLKLHQALRDLKIVLDKTKEERKSS